MMQFLLRGKNSEMLSGETKLGAPMGKEMNVSYCKVVKKAHGKTQPLYTFSTFILFFPLQIGLS